MTSDLEQITTDNRELTRRRRERRTDTVFEIPFNRRVAVECPECGESTTVLIATGDPEETSPSFDSCWTWDCDSFHKFVWDGTGPNPGSQAEGPTQTGLTQFAGGES